MEFEIASDHVPGMQRSPRTKSLANADPREYARRHHQGCFIPDEDSTPPQQMA